MLTKRLLSVKNSVLSESLVVDSVIPIKSFASIGLLNVKKSAVELTNTLSLFLD